jgi:predicted N-acetyltransferase YhbS
MTAQLARLPTKPPAPLVGPRAPRASEILTLERWLDEGLRRGEHGRLASEYPLSMGAREPSAHRVVFTEGRPVAHAMLQLSLLCGPHARLRVALIGNVYSEPAWRGRGLAQRCVRACVETARARGCGAVLLWSELASYYARMGFRPAGRERRIALTREVVARAQAGLPVTAVSERAVDADFAQLEALYAAKPARVVRAPGALAQLARAPLVDLRVARRDGIAVAYAACGRGDDLRGVVHEWAGDASGVLACIADLVQNADAGMLLASALREEPAERLVAVGARVAAHPLALAKALTPGALAALGGLYLWGFDSI